MICLEILGQLLQELKIVIFTTESHFFIHFSTVTTYHYPIFAFSCFQKLLRNLQKVIYKLDCFSKKDLRDFIK